MYALQCGTRCKDVASPCQALVRCSAGASQIEEMNLSILSVTGVCRHMLHDTCPVTAAKHWWPACRTINQVPLRPPLRI